MTGRYPRQQPSSSKNSAGSCKTRVSGSSHPKTSRYSSACVSAREAAKTLPLKPSQVNCLRRLADFCLDGFIKKFLQQGGFSVLHGSGRKSKIGESLNLPPNVRRLSVKSSRLSNCILVSANDAKTRDSLVAYFALFLWCP